MDPLQRDTLCNRLKHAKISLGLLGSPVGAGDKSKAGLSFRSA